jgi:hypothetical protein
MFRKFAEAAGLSGSEQADHAEIREIQANRHNAGI